MNLASAQRRPGQPLRAPQAADPATTSCAAADARAGREGPRTTPRSPTSRRAADVGRRAPSTSTSTPRTRSTTRWSRTRCSGSRRPSTPRATGVDDPVEQTPRRPPRVLPLRAGEPRGLQDRLRTDRGATTTSCGARRRSSRPTSSRPSATASQRGVFGAVAPAIAAQALVGMATQLLAWWTEHEAVPSSGSKRPSSRSPCAGSEPARHRRRIAPCTTAAVGQPRRHDERERQIELLSTTFNTAYTWNYEMVRRELHNLYEKAKRDQWNATEQLAWRLDVDPEAEILPDMQIPIYGTHIWEKLTPAEMQEAAPRAAPLDRCRSSCTASRARCSRPRRSSTPRRGSRPSSTARRR